MFSAGYISHEGPSEELMSNTMFEMIFMGEGWSADKKLSEGSDQYVDPPNRKMVAKVSGKDPGYGSTSKMVVSSAITILKETDKLPNKYYFLKISFKVVHFFSEDKSRTHYFYVRLQTNFKLYKVADITEC